MLITSSIPRRAQSERIKLSLEKGAVEVRRPLVVSLFFLASTLSRAQRVVGAPLKSGDL
jgi:hypothetical protein